MQPVRIGIIGLGMGGMHARNLAEGKVPGGVLGAVCDVDPQRRAPFAQVPAFARAEDMFAAKVLDAVVVATPHFAHPDLGIAALRAGLHTLVEKPIAVHKREAERLLAVARRRGSPLLAMMLNQRTDPRYRKVRELVQSGALGALQRVTWIITDWFRTQAYYDKGGWRGTWAGEGGGILMNQCPHQLDLLQWLFGMPRTVRAWCNLGKHHRIEVEDEVTAYLEYPGGATGVFLASTGEAPGVNRLEVAGELGRVLVEGDRFEWVRNEVSARTFCRTCPESFPTIPHARESLRFEGTGGQHVEILRNFVDAIATGAPLIAPGPEGLPSVELANAMLYSSERQATVTLPLDGAAFAELLDALVARAARATRAVRPRRRARPARAARPARRQKGRARR